MSAVDPYSVKSWEQRALEAEARIAEMETERDMLLALCDEWLDYQGYDPEIELAPADSLVERTRTALGEQGSRQTPITPREKESS